VGHQIIKYKEKWCVNNINFNSYILALYMKLLIENKYNFRLLSYLKVALIFMASIYEAETWSSDTSI